MFRHVALFRFADDAPAGQCQRVADALRALPPQIPDLRAYHVGPDLGLNEGNFDLAVVADFDDEAGYRAYVGHPAHEEVAATQLRPYLASRAAVQYEL